MTLKGQQYTLAQLTALLRIWVDDSSDTRWTAVEKANAIQGAIMAARGAWREERIDDTNTYYSNTFRYTLPPACHQVLEIQLEALDSDEPRKKVSPVAWHVEGTEVVFTHQYTAYDGQTMYIIYAVLPTNLLTIVKTDGAIASTTATALTSTGSTFITNQVLVGDAVIINETGYAGNGTYYVKSVDSETQLTLHKAPGTAGSSLNFTVSQYTDIPLLYLEPAAKARLYEMAFNNAPGTEIDTYIKLTTYYRQVAEQELNKISRRGNVYRSY